eukprot:PhF_6_TR22717/c0_g1_i1/m.32362
MVVSSAAKLFVTAYVPWEFTAYAYHYNSYAAIPCMLKTEKPMVMRDVFLTKATATYPNPLSVLYCSTVEDLVLHVATGVGVGVPLINRYGGAHAWALWFLGGLFASGAYVFHSQLNPEKNYTKYDVCSTGNGGLAAFCGVWIMSPDPKKLLTPMLMSLFFLCYKLNDEYMLARIRLRAAKANTKEVDRQPMIHEWGTLGGMFLGMIYFNLFLRTSMDKAQVNTLFTSMAKTA